MHADWLLLQPHCRHCPVCWHSQLTLILVVSSGLKGSKCAWGLWFLGPGKFQRWICFKDPAFCNLHIALSLFLGLLSSSFADPHCFVQRYQNMAAVQLPAASNFHSEDCSQGMNSYFSDDLQLACSPFPEFCQGDREDRQTAVPTDNIERSDILTVTSAR